MVSDQDEIQDAILAQKVHNEYCLVQLNISNISVGGQVWRGSPMLYNQDPLSCEGSKVGNSYVRFIMMTVIFCYHLQLLLEYFGNCEIGRYGRYVAVSKSFLNLNFAHEWL
jgi:hypothetical protein